MAHFAEIGANNKVLRVVVVADDVLLDVNGTPHEQKGRDYLRDTLGGQWVQTSYNTRANQHLAGGTPFRKNYAATGYTWDEERDAFFPPKPNTWDSWTLNYDIGRWRPPLELPEDSQTYDADGNLITYQWDEDAYQADNTTGWVKTIIEGGVTNV